MLDECIPSPAYPLCQEDDEIPSPSPSMEEYPSPEEHHPLPGTRAEKPDGNEVMPSPHPSLQQDDDLFLETADQENTQVLEGTDSPPEPKASQRTRRQPTWQTVPANEIERSYPQSLNRLQNETEGLAVENHKPPLQKPNLQRSRRGSK